MLQINVLVLCAFLVAACAPEGPQHDIAQVSVEDAWIVSRGVDIPITFVAPLQRSAQRVPLVLLVHGHGGTRNEAGAFVRVAARLAESGIATVRADFPGCGDSKEPFTANNLTNMLQDMDAALRFARDQPGIDSDRIGILGYSMGGRLAMLTNNDDLDAMVLWAPVGIDGPDAMFDFFGGRDNYLQLRSEAQQSGATLYTTSWGQQQHLGKKWFTDMESTQPMRAIASFRGPLLIVHGSNDRVIDPTFAAAVRDAAILSSEVAFDEVAGAGHGFGFFSDAPDVRDYVVTTTVEFFAEHLLDPADGNSAKAP